MPYVPAAERPGLTPVALHRAVTPGELNYQITALILTYLDHKGLSYTAINDIVGALDGAKAEFQRRIVAPYEDRKIADNGDVYLPIEEYLP